MRQRAVDYWYTQAERGIDCRSGARVYSRERVREPEDRKGRWSTVWDWCVYPEGADDPCANGTAQSQVGARAAIREAVRELLDKPQKEAENG